MNNEIFAKVLAPSLGFDKVKVVHYVDKIFEQSLEELLLHGTVSFAGIGTLKRVYHPAEPRQEPGGNLFLFPPRQSVQYADSPSGNAGDFVTDIALSQFNLTEEQAAKFSKGIAATVQKVLEVKGVVEVGHIGSLKKAEDGAVVFKESDWLIELLNKPYANLKPTPVSSKKSQEDAAAAFEESAKRATVQQSVPQATEGQKDVLSYDSASKNIGQDDAPHHEFGELVDVSPQAGQASVENTAWKPVDSSTQNQESAMQSSKSSSDKDDATRSLQDDSDDKKDLSWLYEEEQSNKNLYMIIGGVVVLLIALLSVFVFIGGEEVAENQPAPASEQHAADGEKDEKAAAPAEVSQSVKSTEAVPVEETVPQAPPVEDAVSQAPPKPKRQYAEPNRELKSASSSSGQAKPDTPWFVPPQLTKKIDLSLGGYAISVASFPDKSKAEALTKTYDRKGIGATVWQTEVRGKVFNRVLVGSFRSRLEAVRAKEKAVSVLPKDAFIVKVK